MPISTTLIKSIQDIMRQDAGVDGDAQRLAQLGWLLFLKIFDDQESELELLRDDYASPIPKKLRWRSWAADPEGITGDELLAFVNNTLFPSLKNLKADPRRNPRGFVVQSVFEDAFNYMKSGQLLRQVINRLHEIDFNDQAERHLFNDLYEKILRDLQSAGNAGEFYTPRAVTQFMVDQVAPKLGERILDPACGTGGFLACALGHLYAQVRTVEDRQAWQEAVSGVEKKQLPHLLCITNMLLRGIEVPDRIRHDNTLSRPLRDYRPGDRVDVILTNPPFGGTEEPGIEANFPADVRTKETADLFLVLIMHLLKDGGRAAVVLPDGTLFGEGVKTRIKERLLTECDLHTIVRLPNGVFAPYTGIKTNLLFFTKGRPTQAVWYYEHPYPAGYKSYSKTKPIRIEEFEAEKAWWGSEANGFASRAENEFAWRVGIDEIKSKGFNLDLRNPYHPTEDNHDLPDLHKQHMVLQKRANNSAIDLRNELTEALRGDSIAALTDQFELVAQSTNGVTKIRELVLNLAVRGKVVAQCAKDEPARVLLSKIREIKARKRSDGKSLPASREWNDLSSGTHHFELPSGWEFASLSSLGWFGGGKTPSTSKRDYWDGDIPWVTPKDMKSSMVADSQDKVTLLAQKDGLTLYPPKSVMVVVRSGILRRTVPVAINSVKCTVNQDLKVLTLALPSMAPYVRLMIRGFERFILDNLTKVGTTVESIRFDDFARQSFPIPPIAEQERIMRKVDHLLSLLDRLEEEQMQVSRVQALIADALINGVAGSRLIR